MLTSSVSKYEYYSERHGTTPAVEGILPIGGPQKLVPRRESKDFSLYKQKRWQLGTYNLVVPGSLYPRNCREATSGEHHPRRTTTTTNKAKLQVVFGWVVLFCHCCDGMGWGRTAKRAGGRADGLIRRLPAAHQDRGGGRD